MLKAEKSLPAIALELQQFVAEFCHELDNDGENIIAFYFEDGAFVVGGNTYRGHAGVARFYADRLEKVRTQQKDGVRTARHTFVNLRMEVRDLDNATLNFINLTYTGEGRPPIVDVGGPAVISDCRMVCRRDADGKWRLKRFEGDTIFLGGNDALMRQMALKN
jgi:hypothetical protein